MLVSEEEVRLSCPGFRGHRFPRGARNGRLLASPAYPASKTRLEAQSLKVDFSFPPAYPCGNKHTVKLNSLVGTPGPKYR